MKSLRNLCQIKSYHITEADKFKNGAKKNTHMSRKK